MCPAQEAQEPSAPQPVVLPHVPQVTFTDIGLTARDDEGATALHFAARGGHTPILDRLLLMGAPVVTDSWGGTPLHDAAENGHVEVRWARWGAAQGGPGAPGAGRPEGSPCPGFLGKHPTRSAALRESCHGSPSADGPSEGTRLSAWEPNLCLPGAQPSPAQRLRPASE